MEKKIYSSFNSSASLFENCISKEETLTSLLENMSVEEMADTLIVVFVAETDFHHVTSISILLEEKFSEVHFELPQMISTLVSMQHLQSGLLEIISPPPQFYPDLTRLEETLGNNASKFFRQKCSTQVTAWIV